MIAPSSASYPILGAALFHRVDYGLALELAFCLLHCRIGDERRNAANDAIAERHGPEACDKIRNSLKRAKAEGRLTYAGGIA